MMGLDLRLKTLFWTGRGIQRSSSVDIVVFSFCIDLRCVFNRWRTRESVKIVQVDVAAQVVGQSWAPKQSTATGNYGEDLESRMAVQLPELHTLQTIDARALYGSPCQSASSATANFLKIIGLPK
jgi:hypothetical protein